MNSWTQVSIDLANNKNYLDQLFRVYPVIPNINREIDENIWNSIEINYKNKNKIELIENLLKLELFPIKDSYIAYLRKDSGAIKRNPETVNRIFGTLFEMGLDDIYDKIIQPKENNRQMGQAFKNWFVGGNIGCEIIDNEKKFLSANIGSILNVSEEKLLNFAKNNLGYNENKRPDFIAKFNNKYVIGEAKFITDFGGHQDRQFDDAIGLLDSKATTNVIKVAVLDGVIYIKNNDAKICKYVRESNDYIMSSLVLREFLYSL